MKRIIIHWTAGTHTVSPLDRQHYHFIISGKGNIVSGNKSPEDNLSTQDGVYAAHTLNANTGAIGIAVAAMAGAVERPFHAGGYPITSRQFTVLADKVARLCKEYGIPVTRSTVLTHAEVQPTLGIKQKGKWDITWLPGMSKPGNPVEVGDTIRNAILMSQSAPVAPTKPTVTPVQRHPDPPALGFWAMLFEALRGIFTGRAK